MLTLQIALRKSEKVKLKKEHSRRHDKMHK